MSVAVTTRKQQNKAFSWRDRASTPVSSSASRRRAPASVTPLSWDKQHIAAMSSITIDPELKPGEFVIKSLFAEFAVLAEKKIEMVMAEPLESLSRSLKEGKMHNLTSRIIKWVANGNVAIHRNQYNASHGSHVHCDDWNVIENAQGVAKSPANSPFDAFDRYHQKTHNEIRYCQREEDEVGGQWSSLWQEENMKNPGKQPRKRKNISAAPPPRHTYRLFRNSAYASMSVCRYTID
ncbi:hypothetical protein WMY93_004065 [Mugilogobius chulae]|uniref:Uncharacterized protein n=1 Tax=Mugilogobius chulae TaxID=88201 RepID=A0AAW0PVZ5_9GOBI